jgi:hypothetical protein
MARPVQRGAWIGYIDTLERGSEAFLKWFWICYSTEALSLSWACRRRTLTMMRRTKKTSLRKKKSQRSENRMNVDAYLRRGHSRTRCG